MEAADRIIDNFLDEVIDFIWRRSPLWGQIITREQTKKYFLNNADKLYVHKNGNGIEVVTFYQRAKDEIHFLSLTVNEKSDGIRLIREALRKIINKEKPKRVSWLTPEFNFKTFKIKEGV